MKNSKLAATVTVEWGYECPSITLTPRNWAAIKAGHAHYQRGAGYYYEGEFFWDYWRFAGGLDGELAVTYGEGENCGGGFEGVLYSATIEEHEYEPKRRNSSKANG